LTDLILFIALIAVWLWIAWAIFRRVGFFGANKPPRFSVEKDGRTFTNATSTYLLNGIVDARHLVFVFEAQDGTPFVYMPRDRDVRILAGEAALEDFVRTYCGGDKGLAKLSQERERRAKR